MRRYEFGCDQASLISPLLANVYLHYVLDLWAKRWRRREAAGDMIIVRYADDFIELIVAQAAQDRLPAIYPYDYFAEGLVSYGSDTLALYRRAAGYVDRILRGTKPADLTVQAPVKFDLVINLKAAKAIGIEVSNNVLLLADRVSSGQRIGSSFRARNAFRYRGFWNLSTNSSTGGRVGVTGCTEKSRGS